MAIGFGSLWNDTRMGETWMIEPDADGKVSNDFAAEDLPGWKLEPGAGRQTPATVGTCDVARLDA